MTDSTTRADSADSQPLFDFDLKPKLAAISALDAPPVVRKFLRAVAIYGCANGGEVALGSGGDDGEWLLSPKRRLVCEHAGINEATWKRWLASEALQDSPFVWLKRWPNCEAEIVVFWSRIFESYDAGELRRRETRRRIRAPTSKCAGANVTPVTNAPAQNAPAHFEIDPPEHGEGMGMRMVVLKPTKETKTKENHQPTIAGELGGKTEIRKAPSKEEGQEGAKRRPWIGVSIAPHDLRHPTGLWKIFQAAVRTGRVNERDALPCLAFLAWVNDQPDAGKGAIHDKGAFIVAALSGDRANWSHRFSPPHFARAKEVVESVKQLQTGRGAPPAALLSLSRRQGDPDAH